MIRKALKVARRDGTALVLPGLNVELEGWGQTHEALNARHIIHRVVSPRVLRGQRHPLTR